MKKSTQIAKQKVIALKTKLCLKNKKPSFSALLLSSALILLTACSGDDGNSDSGAAQSASSSSSSNNTVTDNSSQDDSQDSSQSGSPNTSPDNEPEENPSSVEDNSFDNEKTESLASASIETTKAILLSEKAVALFPEAETLLTTLDPIEAIASAINNTTINSSSNNNAADFIQFFDFSIASTGTITGIEGQCGGDASIDFDVQAPNGDLSARPLTIALSGSLNNFCNWYLNPTDTITLHGDLGLFLHLESNQSGYVDIIYNLDIDSRIPDYTYNGNHTYQQYCSFAENQLTCRESASHSSGTDVTFILNDAVFSGDNIDGYYAAAQLHYRNLITADEETFAVTINDVVLCDNGNIQSGEIVITDNPSGTSPNAISLNFSSCENVVISHQNNSWVMEQPSLF